MIFFESLQKALTGHTSAIILSQSIGFNREVTDGGTKNRIWTFLTNSGLASSSMMPLMELFPNTSFVLPFWGAMLVNAGVCYLASIHHQNNILINQGKHNQIKVLPFNLHTNQFLNKLAKFISYNMGYFFLAVYAASLVACVMYGSLVYGIGAIGGLVLDQIYQNGYMPEPLRLPYMYANFLAGFVAVISFNNAFSICLGLSFLGYAVYDHCVRYLWNTSSPTSQFPMADESMKIAIPKDIGLRPTFRQDLEIYRNKRHGDGNPTKYTKRLKHMNRIAESINEVMPYRPLFDSRGRVWQWDTFKDSSAKVTFDHFYDAFQMTQDLLKDVPKDINVDQYIILFEQIDFSDISLRDQIENQMVDHEKFNEIFTFDENGKLILVKNELLSNNHKTKESGNFEIGMSRTDVAIEFLKVEMSWVPARLNSETSRDLTPYQFQEMKAYGRLTLSKIQTDPITNRQLLIAVAIQTGTACNRAYLEGFSFIALKYDFLKIPNSTFHQKITIELQKVRERRFKHYYYAYIKEAKKHDAIIKIIYADQDDYHTYESFVTAFGTNFYLINSSLMTGLRDITEVVRDYVLNWMLSRIRLSFDCFYCADYLVQEVLNPSNGTLHNLFLKWCREHHIQLKPKYEKTSSNYGLGETQRVLKSEGLYYDEMMLKREDRIPEVLAELMLLDLNIIQHDNQDWIPRSLLEKGSSHQSYVQLTASVSFEPA